MHSPNDLRRSKDAAQVHLLYVYARIRRPEMKKKKPITPSGGVWPRARAIMYNVVVRARIYYITLRTVPTHRLVRNAGFYWEKKDVRKSRRVHTTRHRRRSHAYRTWGPVDVFDFLLYDVRKWLLARRTIHFCAVFTKFRRPNIKPAVFHSDPPLATPAVDLKITTEYLYAPAPYP